MSRPSDTNSVRQSFLEFFGARGHQPVPSAPLVPNNDPTLLFTNAGMVPFKNVFTGAETRDYSRAVSSQKCLRAGGKHNDLDNVGYTARHHTFFEMLGNFSFGDYFKDQAIGFAWDLVTGTFGLDRDRLLVTVYHDDDEAFDLWRKIAGLPEERIIRIATSDNFWSMGDTGPCGPCSEIFFDHGADIPGGPPGSPDEDGDRFIEIWNLVFMQFEQPGDGTRHALPKPSIDTGMGLERIAAVLQGVHDNYDIDLFKKLIAASVDLTGVKAEGKERASHRVIADHLRAMSFLIADGVLPSNEGRGYVLRRIMRRAMRHAHMLGTRAPLMHRLVPALVDEMGTAFGELRRAQPLITETLKLEEERFRSMLERGLRLLDEEVGKLSPSQALPGDVAFRLYDTFGFPLDLTQDALREDGRVVDSAGFETAMAEQRAKARAAWSGSGQKSTEKLWFDLRDEAGGTEFLGYSALDAEGKTLALVKDGERIDGVDAGAVVQLVVNQTPFYAESGGQAGDRGTVSGDNGFEGKVLDTRKQIGALWVHELEVTAGSLRVGDVVHLHVDADRRNRIRANHSATHLLHAALRKHLGPHVAQKGSLVSDDRLRFDFTHPKALDADDLAQIEAQVNALIRQNGDVSTRLMSYDDALEAGAVALFGEKYGDEVRVLSMGNDTQDDAAYSVELCGGTHVHRLGDIALFKIVSEGAVASGVRRIEALTGEAARRYLLDEEALLRSAAAQLKVAPADLPERVSQLADQVKKLERALSDAKKALALGGGTAKGADTETLGDVVFLGQVLDGVNPKDLRGLADDAKKKLGSGVTAFVAVNDGKAAVLVGVTDDLTDQLSAVELVKVAAKALGGKGGGGRADMAQAGGPDGAKAETALEHIREMILRVNAPAE